MQQREGLLELVHVEGAEVPALGAGGHIVSGDLAAAVAARRIHSPLFSLSLLRFARASPFRPSLTRLPDLSALAPR